MCNMHATASLTASMKFFAYFYALFGIRVDYDAEQCLIEGKSWPRTAVAKLSKWMSRHPIYMIVQSIAASAYVLFVVGTSELIAALTPDQPSLLDLVRILYYVTSFVIILLGALIMNYYSSTISQILFSPDGFPRRFYLAHFIYSLSLTVPSLLVDLDDAIQTFVNDRSVVIKAGVLCGLYVWQVQYALICMYLQCACVIRRQLQDVTVMVRAVSPTRESAYRLTCAKSSIRTTIEKMNSIFGTILLVYYVKMFALITLRLGAVVLWGTGRKRSPLRSTAQFLAACVQIVQIFETTRLGSEIISEAQRAERILFLPRKAWLDDASLRVMWEIREVLSYREHLDALTVSDSFVCRKTTMFTYLGTMFTCIAVILQFDYDILRALDAARATFTDDETLVANKWQPLSFGPTERP